MKNTTAAKKTYKAPALVKSVQVGKIMVGPCSGSCGSAVMWTLSKCAH